MKKLMVVALACLGLCGFGGVEGELDAQINTLNADIKVLDAWHTNAITRICGISIGDTLDDITKNNIFDKDPAPRKSFDRDGNLESIHGMLAKPFRQFFCAEVFFTPSGKAWKIRFSMPAEDFTQVRAEAEQVVPILQKHFGGKMGERCKAVNNSEEVGYFFEYLPESIRESSFYKNQTRFISNSLSIWSGLKTVDPVFGRGSKVLYMDVENELFSLREKKIIALRELQEKKSKLKKTDEGIDAL